MKKILVPTDFSEPASQAFRFAVDVAGKNRGEVNLLHVIELPTLYDSAAVLEFEKAYMDECQAKVRRKFDRLKNKYSRSGVKFTLDILFGSTVTRIRDFMEGKKFDLVVLGTNGVTGIKEVFIGSNTEKIVRSSELPVIAIKKAPEAIRNIVFPVVPDMKQEKLTMKLKELQDFFGAKLHVLFVNTPSNFRSDRENMAALNAMAKRFMLKNFTLNVYNDRTEEEGIINFANQIGADLIAMRTHGRRGIAHLATGSIAEDVVNHIPCAVWTYKIK